MLRWAEKEQDIGILHTKNTNKTTFVKIYNKEKAIQISELEFTYFTKIFNLIE